MDPSSSNQLHFRINERACLKMSVILRQKKGPSWRASATAIARMSILILLFQFSAANSVILFGQIESLKINLSRNKTTLKQDEIALQRSVVIMTPVRVTIGYSDSLLLLSYTVNLKFK